MSRHDRLIGKAIDLAGTSEYRWRHGAILARGSKIIASSVNELRNPPTIDPDNVSFHAEEKVIREYCRIIGVSYLRPLDLSNFTLYVARVGKGGDPVLSRPCSDCMNNMAYFGIKDFVYTNELGGFSHETVNW